MGKGIAWREHLGDKFSEGARLVWLEMARHKMTIADVARRLGADRAVVSRWLYGDRLPNRVHGERLETEFGIALSAWDTKPTRRFVPPGAKRASGGSP